jgi:hypothetical protein
MQPRKLYLDTASRKFIASPTTTLSATEVNLFEEDVEDIELYFLRPTGEASAPYAFEDYSALNATFAVGAGTPAAIVTSFSAISTTVSVSASTSITGAPGNVAIQRVEISPSPASGYYSLVLPTRSITVSSVTASIFLAPYHALIEGQSITLTGFSSPTGFANGATVFVRDRARDTFKISAAQGSDPLSVSVASGGGTAVAPNYTTEPLSAGATPAEIAAALAVAAGSPSQEISVRGSSEEYNIVYGGAYAGAAMPLVQITANTLEGPPGLVGQLNLDTLEIAALVAAETTDVAIEVEIDDGTLRHTFRGQATLGDDLITASGAPSSVAGTSFTLRSADSAVWSVTIDNDGILTATKQ